MHFETKEVNKSVLDYIKEGFIHLLKNPFLYVSTLGICTILTFASSYLPNIFKNIVNLFLGIFIMIWVMELTFSSTKEKYNFKKYITSFVISIIGFKIFIYEVIMKTSAKYALLLFMLICFIPSGIKEEQSFFVHLSYFTNINIFTNIVIFSIWSNFIITDPLVMARMTGDLNIYKTIGAAREAIKINKELIFKMLLVSIALTFTTVIPFSNIIQFIIVISLTLFSIDVYKVRFEVKRTEEDEERQEELKVSNCK